MARSKRHVIRKIEISVRGQETGARRLDKTRDDAISERHPGQERV